MVRVNIHMITYNHEEFIERAIQGVLNQNTTFKYVLLIADDNSTDSTFNILQRYEAEFFDVIRVYRRSENLGAVNNFAEHFKSCSADYVAICEGDDYWLDENKLQKQFDFLENNQRFIGCLHNAKVTGVGVESSYVDSGMKCVVNFDDLLKANSFPTASIFFRRKMLSEQCINLVSAAPVGDWLLLLSLAKFGPFHYDGAEMAVYRVHMQGMWNKKDYVQRQYSLVEIYFYIYTNFKLTKKLKAVLFLSLAGIYSKIRNDYFKKRRLLDAIHYNNKFILANVRVFFYNSFDFLFRYRMFFLY